MKTTAFVSIDVDPIDTHLAGYGITASDCDLIYRRGVPRMLDLFDRLEIKATVFVVARDAEKEKSLWREVVDRGHEIGSHSVTHPIGLTGLEPERLRAELFDSKARLEDAIGRPVIGFRAPGWDVDGDTFRTIKDAGYRYDASLMPSPALATGAILRLFLSEGRMRPHAFWKSLRLSHSLRTPHILKDAGGLREFPIAVSRILRIPFTHTLWYVAPNLLCRRTYRAIGRSGDALSYMLHAADFIGLTEDDIDSRMARHPGMKWPLERKLSLLENVLASISSDYRCHTYAEALENECS
jgi:peptidoglycan/xylan/chitin deacetylase (PgdA/CDA1 family)